MTQSEEYEALVEERCGVIIGRVPKRIVELIISVEKAKEWPTEDMGRAFCSARGVEAPSDIEIGAAADDWRVMLAASPLNPETGVK